MLCWTALALSWALCCVGFGVGCNRFVGGVTSAVIHIVVVGVIIVGSGGGGGGGVL